MIFSELYGAYYNAVAAILREAAAHPVTKEELRRITAENAFSESVLTIEPALTGGKWPLLRPDWPPTPWSSSAWPFWSPSIRAS